MSRKNKRPVHLNLLVIRLPVTGVVSILHRITGVLLVLAFPFFLYYLQESLLDPGRYVRMQEILRLTTVRILLLVLVWMFALHFFSGVRHLLLDIDIGIERSRARTGAWLVLLASLATAFLAGCYLQ